jgi:ABC-type uncharacterized transport system YnjBCD ATPase subunit
VFSSLPGSSRARTAFLRVLQASSPKFFTDFGPLWRLQVTTRAQAKCFDSKIMAQPSFFTENSFKFLDQNTMRRA